MAQISLVLILWSYTEQPFDKVVIKAELDA